MSASYITFNEYSYTYALLWDKIIALVLVFVNNDPDTNYSGLIKNELPSFWKPLEGLFDDTGEDMTDPAGTKRMAMMTIKLMPRNKKVCVFS